MIIYDEYFYVDGDEELFDDPRECERHRDEHFGKIVIGDVEKANKKLPVIRVIGVRHYGGDSVAPLGMLAKYFKEKT